MSSKIGFLLERGKLNPKRIEELQAFVRSEIVRWGEIVKRSGATVD